MPRETSDVLVGCFAGVQTMSQALSGYQDLERVCSLLRHLLPNVVLASVLASVDLSLTRRAAVFTELTEAHDEEAAVPVGQAGTLSGPGAATGPGPVSVPKNVAGAPASGPPPSDARATYPSGRTSSAEHGTARLGRQRTTRRDRAQARAVSV